MSTESARKAAERDKQIVEEAMAHHDKHYWCLVRTLQSRRKGWGELADLIGEGSTIAKAIWDKYINMETPLAACQTVAPPPVQVIEVKPPNAPDRWKVFIGNRFIAEFDYEHEAEAIAVNLRMAFSGAAVSTPLCPACGSAKLDLRRNKGAVWTMCLDCGDVRMIYSATDFRQFFQPAPSPPPTCSWALMENGKVTMQCRLPQGHIPEEAHDYVATPSPRGESK